MMSVDEYIAAQSPEVAQRLRELRKLFHDTLPKTEEAIRYAIPSFTVGSHYLYISAYKHHIGLYPMYGIPEMEDKIAPYRGKGTKDALHFPHTEPLPIELIRQIIIAKSHH
jgi:uncharacterized protein YdhG (YjbR/CyaY superfamily)